MCFRLNASQPAAFQVQTRTKLFSGSSAGFGVDPNTNVAPFDVAMPGSLPSLNRTVVEAAVRLGFALGALRPVAAEPPIKISTQRDFLLNSFLM